MLRCQSKIVQEYKTTKAKSCYPQHAFQIHKRDDLEDCGGEITIKVSVKDEPDYHSDHYAVQEIDVTCSRCRWPYVKGLTDSVEPKESLLSKALAYYLEHETVV